MILVDYPPADAATPRPDRALRVLVVEDEPLQAAMIAMTLEEHGYEVVGPARCFRDAVRLARTASFDAAILDLDLGGEGGGDEIAEMALAAGAAFVFVTAYSREELPPELRAFAHCPKPVEPAALIGALEANMPARPRRRG